jgi:hypothetical protein
VLLMLYCDFSLSFPLGLFDKDIVLFGSKGYCMEGISM